MNSIVVFIGVIVTLATGIPVLIQLLRQHPRGLFILFFAEMWERFSYYGMRGLFVFYLTQHFLFDDKFASGQYGSYTTLVYLLPLIGGLLADRYLGARKAIAFGALLLVFGHLTMAVEGSPAKQTLTYAGATYDVRIKGRMDSRDVKLMVAGQPYAMSAAENGGLKIEGLPAGSVLPGVLPKGSYEQKATRDGNYVGIFYLALSLIIMGVGFLKANISSIVGQLYTEADPRRDPGFTLYYYGVNLGAFWAAILCGYLGQEYGWNWGFGAAGVGMLLGFLTFVIGKPLLQGKGEPPNPELLAKPFIGPINREYFIYGLAIVGLAGVWLMIQRTALVDWSLLIVSLIVLAYVGYFIVTKCTKVERDRMILAMVLIGGSVVFWTLFEQAGTSLNLFAARNTNLGLTDAPIIFNALGHQVFMGTRAMLEAAPPLAGRWWIDMGFGAAQVQSFNAGFILIFAPVFAALWSWLGKMGRDPNPVLKFGLALLQVGAGFLVIVAAQGMADSAFRLPLFVLGLTYLLHTTGELCLSPVGLSQITRLSVPSIVSFMMAVWFLSSSWAQNIGGKIAQMTSADTVGGQVLDPRAALHTSLTVFGWLGGITVAVGILFLAMSPFLKHLAHGELADGPNAPELDGERQAMPHN
ncbi:MAG: transporter [Caulobacter sp.]|nr:transporter [Caulobacter sp.]